MQTPPSWQPNHEWLTNIVSLFRESHNTSNDVHQRIYHTLNNLKRDPEFPNYLAFILANLRSEKEELRQRVGLLLKNLVKESWVKVHPNVKTFCRTQVMQTIGDESPFIRATVGSLISTIVKAEGISSWPGLLQNLHLLLDNANPNLVDGAFNALSKICEENVTDLDSDANKPLAVLIPKFLKFFYHPEVAMRKYALGAVNNFLALMPSALSQQMDQYMMSLFHLTNDSAVEIRKRVCQAFVILLEVALHWLLPHMKNVIQYMLTATRDRDEVVALEACEFWPAYCKSDGVDLSELAAVLPTLVPTLLQCMKYSEIDILLLGGEEDDEHVPDRPEDLPPRFHHARLVGASSTPAQQKPTSSLSLDSGPSDADGDDDSDEEDVWDEDEVSDWNLRKCAASSLDMLANLFRTDILRFLLPCLQQCFTSEQWQIRESGVLALGAVAEGCFEGLHQHLPVLLPYLLKTLSDKKPLVRSICCWTLSRYSKWIMQEKNDEVIFMPLLRELMNRILDSNKKVQEAACSAFATLEEEARDRLVPYLEPILKNLMFAFSRYQVKNLLLLYDAIGTLAEAVGPNLNKPEYTQILMPPLFHKLQKLTDDDRAIFPLLESLTSIAQSLGMGFVPYAPTVYARCLSIIQRILLQQKRALEARPQDAPEYTVVDMPDKDFIVCALDLMSGLAEGLGSSIESLVSSSNTLPLLFECVKDSEPEVRQSAFALLGDIARACIGHLRPYLDRFVPIAAQNLTKNFPSVCNNASWAVGEIAIKVQGDMAPFVPMLLEHLCGLLVSKDCPTNLLENTAITLGRLGLVCPDKVAVALEGIGSGWCYYLAMIREDAEKEHAFRGLCLVIRANPRGILPHLASFCGAVASWKSPAPPLMLIFKEILHALKNGLKEHWAPATANVSPAVKEHLARIYEI